MWFKCRLRISKGSKFQIVVCGNVVREYWEVLFLITVPSYQGACSQKIFAFSKPQEELFSVFPETNFDKIVRFSVAQEINMYAVKSEQPRYPASNGADYRK